MLKRWKTENLAIFLEIPFLFLRCEMRAPSGISPISLYILAMEFTAGSLWRAHSPKQMELQMKTQSHTHTQKEK